MIACSKFNGYSRDGRRIYFKGGGGGGDSNSVTTQEIPDELKPLATAYTNKAINLSNQGYTPYTGQRYADLNGTQNYAIGMIQNRAANGSDTIDAANSYVTNTLNGTNLGTNPYAGANPYLENAINKSLDSVQGRVNSQFVNNNYGTTAHQETLANALSDTDSAMRMQDYTTQQGLAESALNRNLSAQQNAAGMATTLGNQTYTDAAQLLNAGQIQQDQAQQNLDYGYQQYQDAQNLPYQQLAAMSGVFGSNLGATSSTTQSGGGGK